MRRLDIRLKELCSGLDTGPGFEDRLQARIALLSAARRAPLSAMDLARLEREHDSAVAVVDRAARVDAVAIAIGGLGSLAAVWRFAPQMLQWYDTVAVRIDPMVIAVGTLAIAGVSLWGLLRQFNVNPRSLVGA